MERLYLRKTRVADSGLAHLKGLTELKELDLGRTQANDSGLAHLNPDFPNKNFVYGMKFAPEP